MNYLCAISAAAAAACLLAVRPTRGQDIEVDVATQCGDGGLTASDYKTLGQYRRACLEKLAALVYDQITSYISSHVAVTVDVSGTSTTYNINMRQIRSDIIGVSGRRMDNKTKSLVAWMGERKIRKNKTSGKWTRKFRHNLLDRAIRQYVKALWKAYKAELAAAAAAA